MSSIEYGKSKIAANLENGIGKRVR